MHTFGILFKGLNENFYQSSLKPVIEVLLTLLSTNAIAHALIKQRSNFDFLLGSITFCYSVSVKRVSNQCI